MVYLWDFMGFHGISWRFSGDVMGSGDLMGLTLQLT
jgi:hypothetical protein